MIGNESENLDYMGSVLAIGKGADKDGTCRIVSKALGSDSAGRGNRREDELSRATLEDLGEIFTLGRDGRYSAFANWTRRRKTGKGIGLSPINSIFLKDATGLPDHLGKGVVDES